MTTIKLYISFNLAGKRTNKKGLNPIRCRITYNKQREEISTGLFVDPNHWDSKKQKLLDTSDQEESWRRDEKIEWKIRELK